MGGPGGTLSGSGPRTGKILAGALVPGPFIVLQQQPPPQTNANKDKSTGT